MSKQEIERMLDALESQLNPDFSKPVVLRKGDVDDNFLTEACRLLKSSKPPSNQSGKVKRRRELYSLSTRERSQFKSR